MTPNTINVLKQKNAAPQPGVFIATAAAAAAAALQQSSNAGPGQTQEGQMSQSWVNPWEA
jgi:hypothetical protein